MPSLRAEQLQRVIDAAPEFIASLDTDFKFATFNRAYAAEFERTFGLRISVGTPLDVLKESFPQVYTRMRANWARALIGEEFSYIEQFSNGESEPRWYEVSYSTIRNDEGVITAALQISRNITARHLAELEHQYELNFMADLMPHMVWVTWPDGTIHYLNRRWYEYTGLSEEKMLDWKAIMLPEDFEHSRHRWFHALKTGLPYEAEYRLRRYDGDYRWHLVRSVPRLDEEGRTIRWYGTCTDIHDQKIAEQALRESEAKLRELNATLEARVEERTREMLQVYRQFEQAQRATATAYARLHGILEGTPDMIAALDTDFRYIAFNASYATAFEQYFGRKLTVGFNAMELIADEPANQEQARSIWGKAFKGETYIEVTPVVHPPGAERYYETRYSPIQDESGDIIGAASFSRDVTERVRSEEAVRQSEAHFREALRNVPIVLARLDRDLRYEWIHNPHPDFARMIGQRAEDYFGQSGQDVNQLRREALETGESVRREIVMTLSDGEHYYDMTATPLRDPRGEIVALTSVAFEITDRKRAEKELRQSKAALEHTVRELRHRNRELQDFAYVASHDLQEPLRKIRTFGGLLFAEHGEQLNEEGARSSSACRMQPPGCPHLFRICWHFPGCPHAAAPSFRSI